MRHNRPMKLTGACGARSLSPGRYAGDTEQPVALVADARSKLSRDTGMVRVSGLGAPSYTQRDAIPNLPWEAALCPSRPQSSLA